MNGLGIAHDVEDNEERVPPGPGVVIPGGAAALGIGRRQRIEQVTVAGGPGVGAQGAGMPTVLALPIADHGKERRLGRRLTEVAPKVDVGCLGQLRAGERRIELLVRHREHIAEADDQVGLGVADGVHGGLERCPDLGPEKTEVHQGGQGLLVGGIEPGELRNRQMGIREQRHRERGARCCAGRQASRLSVPKLAVLRDRGQNVGGRGVGCQVVDRDVVGGPFGQGDANGRSSLDVNLRGCGDRAVDQAQDCRTIRGPAHQRRRDQDLQLIRGQLLGIVRTMAA